MVLLRIHMALVSNVAAKSLTQRLDKRDKIYQRLDKGGLSLIIGHVRCNGTPLIRRPNYHFFEQCVILFLQRIIRL